MSILDQIIQIIHIIFVIDYSNMIFQLFHKNNYCKPFIISLLKQMFYIVQVTVYSLVIPFKIVWHDNIKTKIW